jgi:hypothetical protein
MDKIKLNMKNKIMLLIFLLAISVICFSARVLAAEAGLLLYDSLDNGSPGIKDSSTYFSGQYNTYDSSYLNPNSGTIEFWIKPEMIPGADFGLFEAGTLGYANSMGIFNIYRCSGSCAYPRRTLFEIRNNGSVYYQAWNNPSYNSDLRNNTWTFVSVTWKCNSGNNDFMAIYVNGVLGQKLTNSVCDNFKLPSKIYIGKTTWYGYSRAYYDEFKIFNYAKTDSQIKADYNSYSQTICSKDSDCGTNFFSGTPFCIGKNVIQDFTSYKCLFAGKPNSQCLSFALPKLVQTCPNGCSSGACK